MIEPREFGVSEEGPPAICSWLVRSFYRGSADSWQVHSSCLMHNAKGFFVIHYVHSSE